MQSCGASEGGPAEGLTVEMLFSEPGVQLLFAGAGRGSPCAQFVRSDRNNGHARQAENIAAAFSI